MCVQRDESTICKRKVPREKWDEGSGWMNMHMDG